MNDVTETGTDDISVLDLLVVVWKFRIFIILVTILSMIGMMGILVFKEARTIPLPIPLPTPPPTPSPIVQFSVRSTILFSPISLNRTPEHTTSLNYLVYFQTAYWILQLMKNPDSLDAMLQQTPDWNQPTNPAIVRALRSMSIEKKGGAEQIISIRVYAKTANVASKSLAFALDLLEARLGIVGFPHDSIRSVPMFFYLEPPTHPIRLKNTDPVQENTDPVQENTDPAQENTDPAQGNIAIRTIMAGIIGFFVSALCSFLLSYIRRLKNDPAIRDRLRRKMEGQ